MELRTLGRDGPLVSPLGLGCVTFGREIDRDAAFAVMDRALERGITLFDTAEVYARGASETIVGEWLAARGARQQVVLATKVAGALTRERVLASAEASCRRLQTDAVDLFQLHRWDPDVPLDETLGALEALVQRGLARAVGVSNYAAWQVAKALWLQDRRGATPLRTVQLNYNLVVRDIEREHLPLAADQGLGVLSYSPLGAGFLTGKYQRDAALPAGTRFAVAPGHDEIYFSERNFTILDGLRRCATAWGLPLPQLALAWVLGRPGITCVLIGARTPAHVDQVFTAGEQGLSAAQRAELDDLTRPG
ncbi:MAG: aldo/keto reductase [Chloroflexi bacterium]|jgi:aryl-alcohol dehydrogenase-like predicted oxidoreductase|nr:aldo/keto reductase [Chloroflexota bacterium]